MNTNETIAELEARLAALKAEEESQKKAEAERQRQDMRKKQEDADRKLKEEELEKKRTVLVAVANWIKGNAPSLEAIVDATLSESAFGRDIYQYCSITLSKEGFSYKISVTFQNEWSGPRYSGKRDGKLFMKFNERKFYFKKNSGWSYDAIGQEMIRIFDIKAWENKSSKVQASNLNLIKDNLLPELLKIANAKPDEDNLDYDWVQERVLGVKIKPTQHLNKAVNFSFTMNKHLSTDEALQLYKELHRIGLVGGSNGNK